MRKSLSLSKYLHLKPNHSLSVSVILFFLFIHYLKLGRHPVALVITCYISTDYKDFTLKFRYGGLHEKLVVATWNCRGPSQHLLKVPIIDCSIPGFKRNSESSVRYLYLYSS